MANSKEPKFRNKKSPVMAFLAVNGAGEVAADQPVAPVAAASKENVAAPVQAQPVEAVEAGYEGMLVRPQKETCSKRLAINVPPSLYVKLFNLSVQKNMSFNAFVIEVFKDYLGEK